MLYAFLATDHGQLTKSPPFFFCLLPPACCPLSSAPCPLYFPMLYAFSNPKSAIRNPQSPRWLSSQERFGHLAKFCDLTRAFGKFILLQLFDITPYLAFALFWHRFCNREINKQKQIAKFQIQGGVRK
jgi:hypothetical protein